MHSILKNIDRELREALLNSPFNAIDYETLLATDPARIRQEERLLSIEEEPFVIPQNLDIENINITASDLSRQIPLRVYKPKGQQSLPVLLYFHGGSFIYGRPDQYDFICTQLAIAVGMLIASVDYRLAPEHPFPTGMDDGYEALSWLSKNASQMGGDNRRILIGGSSAGATIAAAITHRARDEREFPIQHQFLIYPPMSHQLATPSMETLANAPMQTKTAAKWMWQHYLQDNINHPPPYAVPLLERNFKNLPAATIIVCELDPLKDEGKLYAQQLQEAQVSINLLEIKGAVHAFDFFTCSLADDFYHQQVALWKEILNTEK